MNYDRPINLYAYRQATTAATEIVDGRAKYTKKLEGAESTAR